MAIIEEDNHKPKHGPAVYAILYTGAIAKLLFSYYRVDPEKPIKPADLAELLVPIYGDSALEELSGKQIKADNEDRLKVIYSAVISMCARELRQNDGLCTSVPFSSGASSVADLNISDAAPPPFQHLKHLLTFLEEAIELAFDWTKCQKRLHRNGPWEQAMHQLCEAANTSRNSKKGSNRANVLRVRDVLRTYSDILPMIFGSDLLRKIQVELGLGDMTAMLRAAAIGRSVEAQIKADRTTGGFFVYRRARSSITNRVHDVDLIVRDFIWLLPGFSSTEDAGREVHGYYFSAFDEEVYEITNRPSAVTGPELLKIDAEAKRTNNPNKHLSLYAPKIPYQAADGFSLGTIVGSLRDTQRTGGWTCVLVRPDLEPADVYALNMIAYSFHKLLAPEPKSYGNEIDRFRDAIQSISLMGIYTSRFLERVDDPSVPFTPDCAVLRRADIMACLCHDAMRQTSISSFVDAVIDKHALDNAKETSPPHLDRIRRAITEVIIETSTSATVPNRGTGEIVAMLTGGNRNQAFFRSDGSELNTEALDSFRESTRRLRDVSARRTISMTHYNALETATN